MAAGQHARSIGGADMRCTHRFVSGAVLLQSGAEQLQLAKMTANNAVVNNRQLHPTEKQIIRNELAKKMAKDKGISEAQAAARLEAQLLRQVDGTAASTGSSDSEAALYINSYKATHQGQSVGTDQWGNSVPLFGAVGYQRQDSTIFSANPQTTKPPANVGFSQVGDYLGGVAKGVAQGAKGLVNALLHPIDTVNNLVDAASDLTGTGQKIQQKVGDAINAAQGGNTGPAGELVGEQMGASAAGTAIGAGVSKAVSSAKAANAAAQAEAAAARAAEKVKIENNIRTDDAQQYVNTNAPVQVPQTVTRNDSDFSSTVNHRGNPKAHIDGAKGGVVPSGFANANEFANFGGNVRGGLKSAGYPDVEPILQGSAVTGKSFGTGAPFDVGRVSDFDVALASPSLLQRAQGLGIGVRSGGTRTGPLSRRDLEALGLTQLASELSAQAGRKVSFMIYQSPAAAVQRAPSISLPGGK